MENISKEGSEKDMVITPHQVQTLNLPELSDRVSARSPRDMTALGRWS